MCAQFLVDKILFQKSLSIFSLHLNTIEWKDRILPHSQSPIIEYKNNEYFIELFYFSLVPSWSHDRKPKFATHNARLETVLEKPTWKNLF